MQHLSQIATELGIGWNERALTEKDLHAVCQARRVTLEEMPLAVPGFYFRMLGRDTIAVNSRLERRRKLFVMFHELAHFLFHAPAKGPTASFHGVGRRTRNEIEADAFALCALIPRGALADPLALACLADDEMLSARQALFRTYGI